jgi:hypothetical protein
MPNMNLPRRLVAAVLLIAVLVLGTTDGHGQEVINQEPEIKAGIVVILAKFVTWPTEARPNSEAPVKIGVLGPDPFQQGGINHLDRKAVGQNVAVERFAAVEAYQSSHILVISQAEDLQPALAETQGQHVLTVAQSPGLAKQGAVINLVVEQNRVRMEINPNAAKAAALTIDPRVYRLPMVRIIR